jgi:hypothetical protein
MSLGVRIAITASDSGYGFGDFLSLHAGVVINACVRGNDEFSEERGQGALDDGVVVKVTL